MQRIGFWWAEKKEQDVPSGVLRERLKNNGLELVKLDLNRPFEEQGPFAVVIHKLCDMLVKELSGDKQAGVICKKFDAYCAANPRMRVLDPLDSVRCILDRYKQYQLVKRTLEETGSAISVPPFARLDSADSEANIEIVRNNNLKFPLLLKQIVAHGSRDAHRMYLVLNEDGFRKLKFFPCVVQQYIPHGSVLFKAFVVGSTYRIIKRPSLKDVASSENSLIEFNSHDISKPHSESPLTDREAWLRPDEIGDALISSEELRKGVEAVLKAAKHTLCGIDLIMEKDTKKLYVIDFNNFPGFTGMDDFMPELTKLIVNEANIYKHSSPTNGV